MRYTTSMEIALPRDEVLQLIADPAQTPKWLRGLVLHETVKGGVWTSRHHLARRVPDEQARMEATETITRLEPADLHAVPSSVVVHYER
jgi:uncharacterized protein YndB with AHSA1/START domain